VRAANNSARLIEAARTTEKAVDHDLATPQYIPEDSELHTRRRENLKSRIVLHFKKTSMPNNAQPLLLLLL
jgi:hypothetical protein